MTSQRSCSRSFTHKCRRKKRHGLTIKQCDAYDMADGSSFNLETFLDTCEVDKRFVSEDEYNRGLTRRYVREYGKNMRTANRVSMPA